MFLLYWLEQIRNPVLDAFFSAITYLGDETLFMVMCVVIFWCVNKYEGIFLLSTGITGTVINQFLKITFRIPRPWVRDTSFTIVESAREAAQGYSFPSGHTQTSVGLFGGLARWNKNKVLRIIAISLCVLIPLSRLYLGVHTLLDVGVSVLIALVLVFVGYPLFRKAIDSPKIMYIILGSFTLLSLIYLCFVSFYPFPEEVYSPDVIHNLHSAQKNGYSLSGCLVALLIVYEVDRRWLKFETGGTVPVQIIKIVGGLVLLLAVKELLRFPLNAILPADSIARFIRYFLVVIFAGILWPMTFRFWNKLCKKSKGDAK